MKKFPRTPQSKNTSSYDLHVHELVEHVRGVSSLGYHSRRTVMDRPILLHRRGITVGMGRMDNVAVLGYRLRP